METMLAPVDHLLLGFLAAVAALAVGCLPAPGAVLAGCGALAACISLAARLRAKSPAWETVHAFMPVPVVALLVNLIGPVIESANASRWDAVLRLADEQYLGPLVTAWTQALGRPAWLTDAASLAYASYYLLPVAAAAALWARRRTADFDRFIFALAIALLASYAAYFAFPAAGPRVPDEIASAVLGGGAISSALRALPDPTRGARGPGESRQESRGGSTEIRSK